MWLRHEHLIQCGTKFHMGGFVCIRWREDSDYTNTLRASKAVFFVSRYAPFLTVSALLYCASGPRTTPTFSANAASRHFRPSDLSKRVPRTGTHVAMYNPITTSTSHVNFNCVRRGNRPRNCCFRRCVLRSILFLFLTFSASPAILFMRTWALWNRSTRVAIALGTVYFGVVISTTAFCIFWQDTVISTFESHALPMPLSRYVKWPSISTRSKLGGMMRLLHTQASC